MFRKAVLTAGLAAVTVAGLPTGVNAEAIIAFSCRASVVRVTTEGPLAGINFEPIVANPQEDPCVADEAGIGTVTLPAGLGEVSVLVAETQTTPGQNASSSARVTDVLLTVPGAPVITAEVLTAEAGAVCPPPHLSGGSTVVGLSIGGQDVDVPAGHVDISLGPAGTLHLNESTTTRGPGSGMTVRQALFLDTTLVDIVLAEAVADFEGGPTSMRPCPTTSIG